MLVLHVGLAAYDSSRYPSKHGVCDQTDIFFDSLKFYKTGSDSLRSALHYSVGSRARMEHTDIRAHAAMGLCGLMENLKNIDVPPRIAFVAMFRDPIDRLISALNMAARTSWLAFQRKCCIRGSNRTYDCSSAAIRSIPDCAWHASGRPMPWSSPGPDLNSNVKAIINATVLERLKACSWHRPCGQVTSEMMIQQAHTCASMANPSRFYLWPIETYAPVFQPAGDNVSSIARYLADNFVVGTTQNMSQLFSLLSRILRSDSRATTECMEPYFQYNPAAANVHGGSWPDVDCTRDELSYQTIMELTIKMRTGFGIFFEAERIFEKQMAGVLPLPVHNFSALRRQYSCMW